MTNSWKSNNLSQDDKLPTLGDASSHEDLDIEQRPVDVTQNSSNEVEHPLEEVKSAAPSRRSEIDPFGEPPDGGLNAWLKVLGCFLLYSNIWGFTLTFGAFQAYYQRNFLRNSTPSAISWIGTVQSFFLILVGCLSGPLFDKGWYRVMLIGGNVAVVFGVFMLSLAKNYWQVFLAQGICIGLGAGLLYVPSLALIGLSFSTKRSLAQGIVTSGIAVGGVAYIITFDRLTTSSGFPWAVRVMGFVSLAIALLAIPTLLYGTSSLAKARSARKLWDMSAFTDPNFLIFTACSGSTFFGYIVPYFYIASFAEDTLGTSRNTALYILIGAISASFFGRLSAGLIAHRLGPTFTWFWCTASSSIVSFSWIAVHNRAGLIALGVFWGFCSAGLVTLPAAVFPSLCPEKRRLGTRTGMSWGISSFASLTGPPIAGALLGRSNAPLGQQPRSEYLGPQLWAGCCLLVGSCIIFCLWLRTVREKKKGYFV